MEDDGNHSVIIDIPKLRVCNKISKDLFKPIRIKSELRRIMEKRSRKISESEIHKYSLPCVKPLPVHHFKREELLIPYKVYSKNQHREIQKQKLEISLCNKYKIISTDLKQRLYTENPRDDVEALTDVDEGFYSCINGRPLLDRVPLFKSLKSAVADLLRIRQEIGSRHEGILIIEVNCRQELETYNKTLKRCMEQVKCFDNFISEDYRKSMAFLEEWEHLKSKLRIKITELQNLATEEFTIISRLMGLDYMYGLQQKYGRFLYYLSPPSWRTTHRDFAKSVEIEAKGFDLGYTNEEETFNVVFNKMKQECFGEFVKPVLYFTEPHDLIDIFDGIERQQLHHYSYITHLAPPKKMMREGIKCLKDIIQQESAYVANTIQGFEKLLEFSNERCVELKSKFFTILHGLFYESVGAPEVMKLFLHLEFCYERVNAEKAINMDIVAMAKALEECYMKYSTGLDAIHSDTVKQAVSKSLENEKRKMKRARVAARELRQFDRLERALLRAYEPVPEKFQPIWPRLKHSQKKIRWGYSKLNTKVSNEKPLDDAELEYLTLFTDWTEGEDTAKYLHRVDEENLNIVE